MSLFNFKKIQCTTQVAVHLSEAHEIIKRNFLKYKFVIRLKLNLEIYCDFFFHLHLQLKKR